MPAESATNATPHGWGTTVGTVSGPVFPGVPSGAGIMFINNGSVALAICPANLNSGVLGVYSGFQAGVAAIGGAGSINLNPGDKWIVDTLPCTTPWNGIAASAGGVLTILTF